jgi:hypothetical protein
VNVRHAESLRVLNFLQKDLGASLLFFEIFYRRTNVVLDDVVAKDDADRVTIGKMLR